MQKVEGNIEDLVSMMDRVNGLAVYPVYVPSLKRDVMFKEMNAAQERSIVKTIIDNPAYNIGFLTILCQIIKENCMDSSVDIDSLTLIDKTAISLVMRQKSIGDEFEYIFKKTDKKKLIKISEFIPKINAITLFDDRVITGSNCSVVCGYPTCGDECKLDEVVKQISDSDLDASSKVGQLFINEIVKYVKKITIIDAGSTVEVSMSDLDYVDRTRLVERLNTNVLRQIMMYMEDINKQFNEVLTVELNLEEVDEKQFNKNKLTGTLGVGSDFFIIS